MGKTTFIPKITLQPTTTNVPFKFSRQQFMVKLAFAMTINKAQGQFSQCVGVDLCTLMFSHSQLYIALSRTTSIQLLKVLLPQPIGKTMNIVYSKVLI